jgi:DUF4097 and DUF4098 domain-containing protein YvlB
MHTFDTPEPIRLRVTLAAGDIHIQTGDTTETTVELTTVRHGDAARELLAATTVEQRGNEVVVNVPSRSFGSFGRSGELQAAVTLPNRSDLQLRTRSADVDAIGEFGEVVLETGSGDVRIGTVLADARLRAGSGDMFVHHVGGSLRAESGSGDLTVEEVVGDATVSSGSGDITLNEMHGEAKLSSGSGDILIHDTTSAVTASTASGDVQLMGVRRGRIRANTASGDVHVGVADGAAAWLDVTTVSGDVYSSLERSEQPADDESSVQLHVSTASGDISLVRT